MYDDAELWRREERFWLDGAPQFREAMAPDCIMVFPEPVGILRGEAILESLRLVSRWASVEMTAQALSRQPGTVVVLAYRAEGRREGQEPYRALCSSTYLAGPEGWLLVQHHQTRL